jgi:hypothetical protein
MMACLREKAFTAMVIVPERLERLPDAIVRADGTRTVLVP